MFGGSLFGNDPFFSAHQQQMEAMDRMMQSPFAGMNMGLGFGSVPMMPMQEAPERQRDLARRQDHRSQGAVMLHRPNMMDPFGTSSMFGNMFGMNSMMANMQQNMMTARNDPNSHFMSQSSVMSYSNTGEGPPKVYQATTATRQAPGGVVETKKSVRDSEAAIEKLAVGRYLGDRGHVQERQRNTRTGDLEENQEYQNLDEEEISTFDEEWRGRTQHSSRQARPELARSSVRAITDGQTRSVVPQETVQPQTVQSRHPVQPHHPAQPHHQPQYQHQNSHHQNAQPVQYHPQRDRSRSNPRQYVPHQGDQRPQHMPHPTHQRYRDRE